MRTPAPLAVALLTLACALSACSTAEDYLTNINPFRRQDQAAPPPPAPAPPAQPAPTPPPRPREAPR